MIFFSPKFIHFFSNLEANNNTQWFDKNRNLYEEEVKEPFYDFIDELILNLRVIDNELITEPEKAIFRINNDIRFSKDKIPYKTWMSAFISFYGKKSVDYPGFYIALNHKEVKLAGGVYNPNKEKLSQIREAILEQPNKFIHACRNKEFINRFGGFQSEKLKTLPDEFKYLANEIPELYNKQFYYKTSLEAKVLTTNSLVFSIVEVFESSNLLHNFLKNSINESITV